MARFETPIETPMSADHVVDRARDRVGPPPAPPSESDRVLLRADPSKQSFFSSPAPKQRRPSKSSARKALERLYIHHSYGFRISRHGIKPIRCSCGAHHSKAGTQTNDFNKPIPGPERISEDSAAPKDSKAGSIGLLNGDTAPKIFPGVYFAHSAKVYDRLVSMLIAEVFRGA